MYLGQQELTDTLLAQLPPDFRDALSHPEVRPYVDQLVAKLSSAAAPYALPVAASIAKTKAQDFLNRYGLVLAGAAVLLFLAVKKDGRRVRRGRGR
jgi:hypothetical protein